MDIGASDADISANKKRAEGFSFFKCFDLQGQGAATTIGPRMGQLSHASVIYGRMRREEKKEKSLSGGGRGAEATAGDTAIDLQAA
jgi:hypothetical protein